MNGESTRPTSISARAGGHCLARVVLALSLAATGFTAIVGCAAEDKKPKTVTEFLKQPRVGELPE